jgi:hypothetical protein
MTVGSAHHSSGAGRGVRAGGVLVWWRSPVRRGQDDRGHGPTAQATDACDRPSRRRCRRDVSAATGRAAQAELAVDVGLSGCGRGVRVLGLRGSRRTGRLGGRGTGDHVGRFCGHERLRRPTADPSVPAPASAGRWSGSGRRRGRRRGRLGRAVHRTPPCRASACQYPARR